MSVSFPDSGALTDALSQAIAQALNHGIADRGEAWLVVSGGRTPVPMLESLRDEAVDFSKVTVLLADERWVPLEHTDNNARLVRSHLLQGLAESATLISYVDSHKSIDAQVRRLELQLGALPEFDAVVLGMGLDGHTASLFPETEVLEEGLDPDSDRSILVVQPIDAPHTRLTLTAARLLKTRNLFLHIEGQAKREVFKVAAQQTVVGMPIGFVAQQTQIPMQVYWSP